MGTKTKIEWCDSTWNPVTGCLHGCEYCYARRMAERFGAGWEGLSDAGMHELDSPARGIGCGAAKPRVMPYPFGFQPTFHHYRLGRPQKWKDPRNIFVCSMADLFGDWVSDGWIADVFRACVEAPQHRYLFLTKNPDRYADLYKKGIMPKGADAQNKWYGCSITKPDDPFFWIDEAAYGMEHHGFLSIEPIMADFPAGGGGLPDCIRWIIVGAETGNRKGKIVPEKPWIDHVCGAADRRGIPVFMKDSLIPVVGEGNMRREFPWEAESG